MKQKMAKETFRPTKPHVNVGAIRQMLHQLRWQVQGVHVLETLERMLTVEISQAIELPVVPNSAPLGFSNVLIGVSATDTTRSQARLDGRRGQILLQLSQLKSQLDSNAAPRSIIALMETAVGKNSASTSHEFQLALHHLRAQPQWLQISCLLPAIQKIR